MGRTATNVVGNSIATAVIARTTQLDELSKEVNTSTQVIMSTDQQTS